MGFRNENIRHSNYNGNQNSFNDSFTSTKKKKSSVILSGENSSESEEEIPACCNSFCGHFNCWWQPSPKCQSMEFCRMSSLHGLKYVGNTTGHMLERAFWIVFFLLLTAASVYFIHDVVLKFIYSPVTVTFTEEGIHVDRVPFPAITICNVNTIRKSKVQEYLDTVTKGKMKDGSIPTPAQINSAVAALGFIDHVCDGTSTSFSSKFGFHFSGDGMADKVSKVLEQYSNTVTGADAGLNIKEFLQTGAQPCRELILLCLWRNVNVSCSELFHEVITDFGKCCSFNMIPEPLLYYDYKETNFKPGREQWIQEWQKGEYHIDALISPGVKERWDKDGNLIKLEEVNPRRVRSSGLSNGISVVINPDLDEYYCTGSDSVGFQISVHMPIEVPHVAEYGDAIGPSTETFIKIRTDVTTADEDIRSLNEEVRNCYFNGEYKLDFFTAYTNQNCLDECNSNLTYETCECVRYYAPRSKNDGRPLCSHEQIMGCATHMERHFKPEKKLDYYCGHCLATCNDINYVPEITTRPLRRDVNLWNHHADIEFATWHQKHVSLLHFYFGEDITYPKQRKRLFGPVELIAAVGSLLGLCLGFSVLSGIELVFSIFKKIFGVIFRRGACSCNCCNGDTSSRRLGTPFPPEQRVGNWGQHQQFISNYYPEELVPRHPAPYY